MLRRYVAGESPSEIAAFYGCSAKYPYQLALRAGQLTPSLKHHHRSMASQRAKRQAKRREAIAYMCGAGDID